MSKKIVTGILGVALLFSAHNAYAKSQYRVLTERRAKALKIANACQKKFKKLTNSEKIDCLTKVHNFTSLNIMVLQHDIANLRLATTGY